MREMKNSNTEWLECIPQDWETVPLKSLFTFGKGLPITKENLISSGIPVVSYGQIHAKWNSGVTLHEELKRFVSTDYLASNSSSLVKNGDFIVADTSEDKEGCGNAAYVDTDETLFAGYHTVILKSKVKSENNKYLAYLFLTDAWRSQLRKRVSGIKVFSISRKILGETTVIIPPLPEQRRIANYLDTACSKVDALITNQQAQIEKLKAYKQSLITEVVTHGLNPDTPMKDSGVEWIGMIGDSFEVLPINALFSIEKRILGREPEQVLSITQKGIVPKDITNNEGQMAGSYAHYQIVHIGDFAMNHMDLLTGGVGISEFEGVTSPDYRVFVMKNNELNARYFLYVFETYYRNKIFYAFGQGAANLGRWRLPAQNFKSILIPVPPVSVQSEIVNYLDAKCAKIDALIAIKQQKIDKLTEYKKSLIYEYVTGKKEVT